MLKHEQPAERLQERWEGFPGATTDDIGFTMDILDDIESQYCIDTNRVYATGKSDGAGFVGVLACDEDLSARIGKWRQPFFFFLLSGDGPRDTCLEGIFVCEKQVADMRHLSGIRPGVWCFLRRRYRGQHLRSGKHLVQSGHHVGQKLHARQDRHTYVGVPRAG